MLHFVLSDLSLNASHQIISVAYMPCKKISGSIMLLGVLSDPTDVNIILCASSLEGCEYITEILKVR